MDEITIGDKVYISSKQAAKITGYAKDYVGQLCREGRVEARLVGRNWYVLESAIREHRFGAKESGTSIGEEGVLEAGPEPSSTWQQPVYKPEEPVFVPPITPKPAPQPLQTPAIADMQSAWKEWFEEKKPSFQALPDGSDDFKDEYLPVVLPEAIAEKEETVAISRKSSEPEPVEEQSEEVTVHRSYASMGTGERIPESPVPVVDLSPRHAVRPEWSRKQRTGQPASVGTGITRAALLVLAISVALVALIGTGNAERLLSGTSVDFGIQKSIIDFLGGKSEYNNSL